MPATLLTGVPLSGEMKPSPWTSWMVVVPGTHSGGVGTALQSVTGGGVTPAPAGVGAAAVKSWALLPVLVYGVMVRWSEVLLVSAGVGVPAASLAVPKPRKSTTPAADEQAAAQPVRAVALLTRATLPLLALSAMVPVSFGVGSAAPLPAPAPSLMR